MRTLLALLVTVASMVPMAPQVPARPAPFAPLQAWVDAFNSRDPQRITGQYADDAIFWGTTAKAIATTHEGLWAYFKDAAQRPDTRVTIDSVQLREYGDLVIAGGAYTFADVKDGVASNVRPARFTFVFRREGDRWRIVEHHSSRVPE